MDLCRLMRGAGEGQFALRETEVFHAAAFHEGQGLERFCRWSVKRRPCEGRRSMPTFCRCGHDRERAEVNRTRQRGRAVISIRGWKNGHYSSSVRLGWRVMVARVVVKDAIAQALGKLFVAGGRSFEPAQQCRPVFRSPAGSGFLAVILSSLSRACLRKSN